jgi:hypothetical protein
MYVAERSFERGEREGEGDIHLRDRMTGIR